tara:strand:- start:200 stop:658 length:459 start_codon:yes stop_codon:yes gene_type:complete
MSGKSLAAELVAKTPMMVSEADSSPSAALKHTNAQIAKQGAEQTEANRSVGGRRKRKRKHHQRGGSQQGIIIPQAPATGGSSADANAGIKHNFTAMTQSAENAKYDTPPKVGGRRKTRRKRHKRHKKSRKRRRKTHKKKRKSKRRKTRKNRK